MVAISTGTPRSSPACPERKPLGANFYPEDMTREEFEAWVKTLSAAEREQAEGLLHGDPPRREQAAHARCRTARRTPPICKKAAGLLREAAALTDNASLKKFLTLRADAFLSNDYYASDVAWMDLDAPLDITIGPYETYNDELFGYKAGFEAYITIRDEKETDRLKNFAVASAGSRKQPADRPEVPQSQAGRGGADSRGERSLRRGRRRARRPHRGLQSAQRRARGPREGHRKRVMLKNIQEAKFEQHPDADRRRACCPKAAQGDLSFDYFFTHILAHELSHGIGPHQIQVAGRATTPRQEMKELYSAIEEAKADVTGLFMLQYLFDHGMAARPAAERQLYTTFLASAFRSLRFGLTEAHGKGMALQFNYLTDKGAFVANPDGTFAVDFAKDEGAVRDLTHDLLTIEAQGDYARRQEDAGHAGRDSPRDAAGARWAEEHSDRYRPGQRAVAAKRGQGRCAGLGCGHGAGSAKRRHDCRRGKHECLRHVNGRRKRLPHKPLDRPVFNGLRATSGYRAVPTSSSRPRTRSRRAVD